MRTIIVEIENEKEGQILKEEWKFKTKEIGYTFAKFLFDNIKSDEIPIEIIEQVIDNLIIEVETPEKTILTEKEKIKAEVPFYLFADVINALVSEITQKKRKVK